MSLGKFIKKAAQNGQPFYYHSNLLFKEEVKQRKLENKSRKNNGDH